MSMLVLPASDGPTRRKPFPRDLDLFRLNKMITKYRLAQVEEKCAK